MEQTSQRYNINIKDILKDAIPAGIKSITESIYDIQEKDGNYQPTLTRKEMLKYSMENNEAICYHCDGKGKVFSKTVFVYNETAKNIEKNIFSMPGDNMFSKTIFKYDNSGNLLKQLSYSNDGKYLDTIQYLYDDKGRLSKEERCDSSGGVLSTVKIYDEAGVLTCEEYYEDDILQEKLFYQYDQDGNVIETKSHENTDENWSEKNVSRYDQNGRLIEKASYNATDGLYLKTTYKYDEFGNLTEEINYNVTNESGTTRETPFRKLVNEYEYLKEEK